MFNTSAHLVHYPTRDLRRRLGLLQQGVSMFTHLNDLNTEKSQSSSDLNTEKSQSSSDLNPGNMQSRHAPWDPHTNRDGIIFAFYHT